MKFPKLNVRPQSREFIQEFGGLDRRPRISENCFAEMQNLTGDQYPALSPRKKRGIIGTGKKYNAMLAAGDHRAYVEGNMLHWGDVKMELVAGEDAKRQLVMMGAYIVVFPDAMYLNTADTVDRGDFHVLMESKQHEFTFSMYRRRNMNDLPQAKEDLLSTDENATCRWMGCQYKFRGDLDVVQIAHTPLWFYDFMPGDQPTQITLTGVPNPWFVVNIGGKSSRPFDGYSITWDIYYDDEEIGTPNRINTDNSSPYLVVDILSKSTFIGSVYVKDKFGRLIVKHTLYPGSYPEYQKEPTEAYWLRHDYVEGTVKLLLNEKQVESVLCISSDWFSLERFPKCGIEEGDTFKAVLSTKKGENFKIPYLSSIPTSEAEFCLQDGCLWMVGILRDTPTFTTVSRDMFNNSKSEYTCSLRVAASPIMDFVIESQNRLWGCRYGLNKGGRFVNQIYASALGDFRQWYKDEKVSTDSYSASVGIPGLFTGAVNYRGYPLFFKENIMYKVYGDYPENYQIVSDPSMGVQKDCDKSLFVLSNVLYYRSPDGLFAYNGSTNERIDAVLGNEHYTDVACCGTGTKLWVSMTGEREDHSGLYVCDTEKGLWHKEDGVIAQHMVRFENDVYIADDTARLFTVNGSAGDVEEDEVRFFAETGVIGYSTPDSKYVSRFALRVAVPHDGSLQIFVEYDSANVWEFKGSIEGNGMGTFTVPVVPRRCDHFRIRLAGKGDCRIFGFSKVLEEGGSV